MLKRERNMSENLIWRPKESTDVDKVFAAEDKFLRGQRLMERGEFKALEYFVGACELNPGSERRKLSPIC